MRHGFDRCFVEILANGGVLYGSYGWIGGGDCPGRIDAAIRPAFKTIYHQPINDGKDMLGDLTDIASLGELLHERGWVHAALALHRREADPFGPNLSVQPA